MEVTLHSMNIAMTGIKMGMVVILLGKLDRYKGLLQVVPTTRIQQQTKPFVAFRSR
jgi:hypothetical protein